MAAPVPTITVNFDIPMLAQLVQSNNDLRREVSDLRTQLSTRLDAIEARLHQQIIHAQDLDHDITSVHDDRHMDESRRVDQDLDVQSSNSADPDTHTQDDDEDDRAQDGNLANEHDSAEGPDLVPDHDSAHDSSPSVDAGLTVMDHVSPLTVAGKKRKRTAKPAASKSPYIIHSGFVVRSSDVQLAQRRLEEPRPSRSESPFDSNIDVRESSDRLDTIPPVRPQSRVPAAPLRKMRPQRTRTVMDDTDETFTQASAEITMRYDHCICGMSKTNACNSQYGRPRRQAQRAPGFVDTPKPGELAKLLRQSKKNQSSLARRSNWYT